MQLFLNTNGFERSAWLDEFLRTTIVFAVWRHSERIQHVTVQLEPLLEKGSDQRVHCRLEAATANGVVSVGSSRSNLCEAIRGAADRLEVALHRRGADRHTGFSTHQPAQQAA